MPRNDWGVPTEDAPTPRSFSEWTLVGLVVDSDGSLILGDGETSGTATSPVIFCTDWRWYESMWATADRETGCGIRFQYRAGATSGACTGASWGTYEDTFNLAGEFGFDLRTALLNDDTIPTGGYLQVIAYLESE
jgi:hypothetical protein